MYFLAYMKQKMQCLFTIFYPFDAEISEAISSFECMKNKHFCREYLNF